MTTDQLPPIAHSSGTFAVGGDLPVHRLGFGAMRITGRRHLGRARRPRRGRSPCCAAPSSSASTSSTPPTPTGRSSPRTSSARRCTPTTDVVIATKGGLTRQGPDKWAPVGQPRLPAPVRGDVPATARRRTASTSTSCTGSTPTSRSRTSSGRCAGLQDAGQDPPPRALGGHRSRSSRRRARSSTVTTVQNLYNLGDRSSEDVLDACEADGIGFIPWFPVAAGPLARPDGPLAGIVTRTGHPRRAAVAGVAAAPLARDASDPGDVVGRAPRGELRCRRREPRRRDVRRPVSAQRLRRRGVAAAPHPSTPPALGHAIRFPSPDPLPEFGKQIDSGEADRDGSSGERPGQSVSPAIRPVIEPSGRMCTRRAAGSRGRPGIVTIDPVLATTNPAPAARRASRTVIVKP